MNKAFLLNLIHQVVFQGLFFAKNAYLGKRISQPIRGNNREAIVSTLFFAVFILTALMLAFSGAPVGAFPVMDTSTAFSIACALLLLNTLVGAATLMTMKESWRVGVPEDQTTELVTEGIFKYSRNPYFTAYILMFAAYTILLQNLALLALSVVGVGLIHWMVKREERYLSRVHADSYVRYKAHTPRYLFL